MVEVWVRLLEVLLRSVERLPGVGLRWNWQLYGRLDEHVRRALVLVDVEPVLVLLDVTEDVRLLLLRQLASLGFRWNLFVVEIRGTFVSEVLCVCVGRTHDGRSPN